MADYSFSSSRVRQVAKEVRNPYAQTIEDHNRDIQALADRVTDSWQGTDAIAYIDALKNYGPEIDKLVGTIRAIATTLDKIAELMDEREQQRRDAATSQLSTH